MGIGAQDIDAQNIETPSYGTIRNRSSRNRNVLALAGAIAVMLDGVLGLDDEAPLGKTTLLPALSAVGSFFLRLTIVVLSLFLSALISSSPQ